MKITKMKKTNILTKNSLLIKLDLIGRGVNNAAQIKQKLIFAHIIKTMIITEIILAIIVTTMIIILIPIMTVIIVTIITIIIIS